MIASQVPLLQRYKEEDSSERLNSSSTKAYT